MVGHLVDWSVGQSVAWSVGQSVCWSAGQSVAWLVSWSVGLLIGQLVNRLDDQLVGWLLRWVVVGWSLWPVKRSVGWSVGRLVVSSVGWSVGYAFFFESGTQTKVLDNGFQSPKKVTWKRARTHAHLHMRTDAYTRLIRDYWSRAGLLKAYENSFSDSYASIVISLNLSRNIFCK